MLQVSFFQSVYFESYLDRSGFCVQFWYFLRVFATLAVSGTSGKFCLFGHDYIGNKIQAIIWSWANGRWRDPCDGITTKIVHVSIYFETKFDETVYCWTLFLVIKK